MAIIKCPECGTEISSRAEKCICCGLPMSRVAICEECGTVGFVDNGVCSKCGCPFNGKVQSRRDEVMAYIEKCRERYDDTTRETQTSMISRKEVILNVLSRVVSQICPEDNFEHYFISGGGNPISEKNEENARNVFRIPADVNVYFVTSANMFGGINIGGKGFAITPEGIYYTDDKKNRGLIDIDDFMDADLRIKNYICIDGHEFNTTNKRVVFKMLLDLQNELINELR